MPWSSIDPVPRTTCSSDTPGRPDPSWLDAYFRLAPVWRAFWPGTIDGLENLPDHDRLLLVANHSGLGVTECVTLIDAWITKFGDTRPLAAMAHTALFRLPGVGAALRGFGTVEATRKGAAWARAHGTPLLLFPGGDHESMRPIWRAREVDFDGRKGWIRLAREHDLTIVPVAITGSHVTLPNFGGTKLLSWLTGSRLIGMRRGPLPALSMLAALGSLVATRKSRPSRRALAAFASFWAVALVPWVPSRIGFHVLDPIRQEGRSEEDVYEEVVSALTDRLRAAPLRRSRRV